MKIRHFNTLKWFKSFSDETQKIIYQRVMPELMILTTIHQFDKNTDCMKMIHGEQCSKHQWIQDYNLPGNFNTKHNHYWKTSSTFLWRRLAYYAKNDISKLLSTSSGSYVADGFIWFGSWVWFFSVLILYSFTSSTPRIKIQPCSWQWNLAHIIHLYADSGSINRLSFRATEYPKSDTCKWPSEPQERTKL